MPRDVLDRLLLRDMQAWAVYENPLDVLALVITEIIDYPQKKVCNVFLAAGSELDRWAHLMTDVIEPWAVENGCRELGGYCRDGWVRVLGKQGWEKAYTVMRKNVQ